MFVFIGLKWRVFCDFGRYIGSANKKNKQKLEITTRNRQNQQDIHTLGKKTVQNSPLTCALSAL
jgi:hypothetical protein